MFFVHLQNVREILCCVMRNFPRISQNLKLKISSKFCKITRMKISQPCTLCTCGVRGVGGEPVQPGRTLHTNADCALFVFLSYRFPFCHLLILCLYISQHVIRSPRYNILSRVHTAKKLSRSKL